MSDNANLYDALIVTIPGILAFLSSVVMGIINHNKTKSSEEKLSKDFEEFKEESTKQYQNTLDKAIVLAKETEAKEKQEIIDALENKIKTLKEEFNRVK